MHRAAWRVANWSRRKPLYISFNSLLGYAFLHVCLLTVKECHCDLTVKFSILLISSAFARIYDIRQRWLPTNVPEGWTWLKFSNRPIQCVKNCLSSDSGVGSNLQVGGTRRPKFFWCAPHFSLVPPPHEGAQRLFVTDSETIEVSPSVGSSVCTSTGEIERGAMKVMGPSAVPCRLVGY